jgi:hypothetical protein
MPEKYTIIIRSALSSYIILCGAWFGFAVVDFILHMNAPGKGLGMFALIAAGVGLLFWAWLSGFKLTVSGGILEYRDGFFRSRKIGLEQIRSVRHEWIGWNFLSRNIRIPRFVLVSNDGEEIIWINPKPFERQDLHRVLDAIGKNIN